jgi:hypothetical protein
MSHLNEFFVDSPTNPMKDMMISLESPGCAEHADVRDIFSAHSLLNREAPNIAPLCMHRGTDERMHAIICHHDNPSFMLRRTNQK